MTIMFIVSVVIIAIAIVGCLLCDTRLFRKDGKHPTPPKYKAGKKHAIESVNPETGELMWYPSIAAAKRSGATHVMKHLNKGTLYLGLEWRDVK